MVFYVLPVYRIFYFDFLKWDVIKVKNLLLENLEKN